MPSRWAKLWARPGLRLLDSRNSDPLGLQGLLPGHDLLRRLSHAIGDQGVVQVRQHQGLIPLARRAFGSSAEKPRVDPPGNG